MILMLFEYGVECESGSKSQYRGESELIDLFQSLLDLHNRLVKLSEYKIKQIFCNRINLDISHKMI